MHCKSQNGAGRDLQGRRVCVAWGNTAKCQDVTDAIITDATSAEWPPSVGSRPPAVGLSPIAPSSLLRHWAHRCTIGRAISAAIMLMQATALP